MRARLAPVIGGCLAAGLTVTGVVAAVNRPSYDDGALAAATHRAALAAEDDHSPTREETAEKDPGPPPWAHARAKEHGDKLGAGDRQAIENAISDLRGVLESADADTLRSKTENLAQLAMKLGEAMYRAQAQDSGGGSAGGPDAGGSGGAERDDNVVDADFEEVEEDKKKSA